MIDMPAPPSSPDREPSIRVMMMPRDTNAHGTIFGGVILSYIDQAGAIEARKRCNNSVVTVSMDSVEFKQPVYVGDVLSFNTETVRIGRTSILVRVSVEAERFRDSSQRVPVTTAEITFVALDENRNPVPVLKE
jgi:acyl-CoA thioesterase YciA